MNQDQFLVFDYDKDDAKLKFKDIIKSIQYSYYGVDCTTKLSCSFFSWNESAYKGLYKFDDARYYRLDST